MRWYLWYSLSFRDVEELLNERGLEADHTTIWRWVQRYGPELEAPLLHHLKPTHRSWRVDETCVHVNGRWCCLYRAIDSTVATIDFVLSGLRDAATAKRLFLRALTDPSHRQPRVINTDQARLCGAAISGVKKEGILRRRCRHRPVQYLNNILEQDHRAIKRRVKAKRGFREFHAARRTIQGYEAMVCHERGKPRGFQVRNYSTDEGGPLGTGLQERVSNHLRRLRSKAVVVSAEGKGRAMIGSGNRQEENRKGTTDEVSKRMQ